MSSWSKSSRFKRFRINISNKDGSKISEEIFEDIETFGNTLQWGNFNGMIDYYEPKEVTHYSKGGDELCFSTSYVFISNKPPYGTKEYELKEQLEIELVWVTKRNKTKKSETGMVQSL